MAVLLVDVRANITSKRFICAGMSKSTKAQHLPHLHDNVLHMYSSVRMFGGCIYVRLSGIGSRLHTIECVFHKILHIPPVKTGHSPMHYTYILR